MQIVSYKEVLIKNILVLACLACNDKVRKDFGRTPIYLINLRALVSLPPGNRICSE